MAVAEAVFVFRKALIATPSAANEEPALNPNQPSQSMDAPNITYGIFAGVCVCSLLLPSVREYAAIVEVNANTVMRSFDYLQVQNIIYNKRGIGYFVASGAKELIHSLRKNTFLKEELDYFFRQLYTLDIPIKEIETMYHEFIKKQK